MHRDRIADISSLGNAPPALHDQPARKFSELYGSVSVQSSRWFVFAVMQMVLIIGLVASIMYMTPLRQVVPYIVKVDDQSGNVVGKPVVADEFKSQINDRMVAAEARAFVRSLMTIDPFLTRANLTRVSSRVTGKASSEFKELLAAERPFERLAKTAGLVRTPDNLTVDASQKNVAFVFVQTSERISSGEPIVTRWRFTLHYVTEPAIDAKGLDENPLGFVVTHFERVQDFQK